MKKYLIFGAALALGMGVKAAVVADTTIVKNDTVIIEKNAEWVTVRVKIGKSETEAKEKKPVRKTYVAPYRPCKAIKNGERCRRNALEGKDVCWEH